MNDICYDDNTLVTARAVNYNEAVRLPEVSIHHVVDCIKALVLKISSFKTEALLFHGPRKGPPCCCFLGLLYAFKGKRWRCGRTLNAIKYLNAINNN